MALPNTFATMAAGNVAAADLDANFTYLLNLINNLSGGGLRDYLAGLNLSNDSTTPNSVLDVSPGVAADSTNSVLISLGSIFYGSTGGAWSAGAGTSGSPIDKMGNGLTVADNTWYHVFSIINGGAADVYFDTSVSAANAPSGTTAFRRVGSFKTDANAHILVFFQNGDTFLWGTPPEDFNSTPPTSGTLEAVSVPPGVIVGWFGTLAITGASPYLILSSPNISDPGAPSGTFASISAAGSGGYVFSQPPVMTDTAQHIRLRSNAATGTAVIYTFGWTDTRGRYS